MPQARYEVGIGAIDGVNTTFFVSRPYVIGTVQYFRNGQLLRQVCLTETNSVTGQVDLLEAPLAGDTVQFFYLDTTPDDVTDEISVTVLPVSVQAVAVSVTALAPQPVPVTVLPVLPTPVAVSVSTVAPAPVSVTVSPPTQSQIAVTVTECC